MKVKCTCMDGFFLRGGYEMKRWVSLFLILCLCISIIPVQIPTASAVSVDDFELGMWNMDHSYRQLHSELTKGGYWNPTDAVSYNKLITNGSDSGKFFATPRFTKNQLPVGSVIVVEAGWQYSPEGWINDTVQSTREAVTSQKHIVVTDA